jgi:hypothetical protein
MMAELDKIKCILIHVTGMYKSNISVKFFENIKAKNGKRIISLSDGL